MFGKNKPKTDRKNSTLFKNLRKKAEQKQPTINEAEILLDRVENLIILLETAIKKAPELYANNTAEVNKLFSDSFDELKRLYVLDDEKKLTDAQKERLTSLGKRYEDLRKVWEKDRDHTVVVAEEKKDIERKITESAKKLDDYLEELKTAIESIITTCGKNPYERDKSIDLVNGLSKGTNGIQGLINNAASAELRIENLNKKYAGLNKGAKFDAKHNTLEETIGKLYAKVYVELQASILALTNYAETLTSATEKGKILYSIENMKKVLKSLQGKVNNVEDLNSSLVDKVEERRLEIEASLGLTPAKPLTDTTELEQEFESILMGAANTYIAYVDESISRCENPDHKKYVELASVITAVGNDSKFETLPEETKNRIKTKTIDYIKEESEKRNAKIDLIQRINNFTERFGDGIASFSALFEAIDLTDPQAKDKWQEVIDKLKEAYNVYVNTEEGQQLSKYLKTELDADAYKVRFTLYGVEFPNAGIREYAYVSQGKLDEYNAMLSRKPVEPPQPVVSEEEKRQAMEAIRALLFKHYVAEAANKREALKKFETYTMSTPDIEYEKFGMLTIEEIDEEVARQHKRAEEFLEQEYGKELYEALEVLTNRKKTLEASTSRAFLLETNTDGLTVENYEQNYNDVMTLVQSMVNLSVDNLEVTYDEEHETLSIKVDDIAHGFPLDPLEIKVVSDEMKKAYSELKNKKPEQKPDKPIDPPSGGDKPEEEESKEAKDIIAKYIAIINEINKDVGVINEINAEIETITNSTNLEDLFQNNLGQLQGLTVKEAQAKAVQDAIREKRVQLVMLRVEYTKVTNGKFITMLDEINKLPEFNEKYDSELTAFIRTQDSISLYAECTIKDLNEQIKNGSLSEQEITNARTEITRLVDLVASQESLVNRRLLAEVAMNPQLDVLSIVSQRRENKKALRVEIEELYNKSHTKAQSGPTPSGDSGLGPEGGTKKPEGGTKKPEGGTKKPEGGTKKPSGGAKGEKIEVKLTKRNLSLKPQHVKKAEAVIEGLTDQEAITVEVIKNGLRIRLAEQVSQQLRDLQLRIALIRKDNDQVDLTSSVFQPGKGVRPKLDGRNLDDYRIGLEVAEKGSRDFTEVSEYDMDVIRRR